MVGAGGAGRRRQRQLEAGRRCRGSGRTSSIVRNWSIAAGEFFTDRDIAGANKVCVIGHTVARKLFPGQDPIGQQVRIKNIPFTVIGVLEPKGADLGGNDQDDILLMPYTTVRKRLQGSQFRTWT